jgi:hypothetical protein
MMKNPLRNKTILVRKKYGLDKEKLYSVWKALRKRCCNKNNNDYKYYGGKGVSVYKEWDDYQVFKKYCLDNGWRPELEIDRIDNNGNYEPGNCRFVSHKKNSQTRSTSKLTQTDADGIRLLYSTGRYTQQELSIIYKISRPNVANVLINNIWS